VRADAHATIIRNSGAISNAVHNFGPGGDSPHSTTGGDATGVGDVLLRTKYNFLRGEPAWPDFAVAGQVKLPTGKADDLLGTGDTRFLGLLVASKTFGFVEPHLNVGYDATTGNSKEDNVRYVGGLDARVLPSLTLALDVLGQWRPNGTGIGDNLVDLAVGGRWNIFRSFLFNANVLLPLNKNEGLRPDLIWTVGLEYTF
jgi:hypothetical protein